MMKKTWKSETMSKGILAALIFIGSLFGFLLFFLIARAINGPEEWMIVEESLLQSILIFYFFGLILSAVHLVKDYRRYNGLKLTMDNGVIHFEKPDQSDKTHSLKELRYFKSFSPLYSLFRYCKVVLHFKNPQDHRRSQQIILIRNDAEKAFVKSLQEEQKKAPKTDK